MSACKWICVVSTPLPAETEHNDRCVDAALQHSRAHVWRKTCGVTDFPGSRRAGARKHSLTDDQHFGHRGAAAGVHCARPVADDRSQYWPALYELESPKTDVCRLRFPAPWFLLVWLKSQVRCPPNRGLRGGSSARGSASAAASLRLHACARRAFRAFHDRSSILENPSTDIPALSIVRERSRSVPRTAPDTALLKCSPWLMRSQRQVGTDEAGEQEAEVHRRSWGAALTPPQLPRPRARPWVPAASARRKRPPPT